MTRDREADDSCSMSMFPNLKQLNYNSADTTLLEYHSNYWDGVPGMDSLSTGLLDDSSYEGPDIRFESFNGPDDGRRASNANLEAHGSGVLGTSTMPDLQSVADAAAASSLSVADRLRPSIEDALDPLLRSYNRPATKASSTSISKDCARESSNDEVTLFPGHGLQRCRDTSRNACKFDAFASFNTQRMQLNQHSACEDSESPNGSQNMPVIWPRSHRSNDNARSAGSHISSGAHPFKNFLFNTQIPVYSSENAVANQADNGIQSAARPRQPYYPRPYPQQPIPTASALPQSSQADAEEVTQSWSSTYDLIHAQDPFMGAIGGEYVDLMDAHLPAPSSVDRSPTPQHLQSMCLFPTQRQRVSSFENLHGARASALQSTDAPFGGLLESSPEHDPGQVWKSNGYPPIPLGPPTAILDRDSNNQVLSRLISQSVPGEASHPLIKIPEPPFFPPLRFGGIADAHRCTQKRTKLEHMDYDDAEEIARDPRRWIQRLIYAIQFVQSMQAPDGFEEEDKNDFNNWQQNAQNKCKRLLSGGDLDVEYQAWCLFEAFLTVHRIGFVSPNRESGELPDYWSPLSKRLNDAIDILKGYPLMAARALKGEKLDEFAASPFGSLDIALDTLWVNRKKDRNDKRKATELPPEPKTDHPTRALLTKHPFRRPSAKPKKARKWEDIDKALRNSPGRKKAARA